MSIPALAHSRWKRLCRASRGQFIALRPGFGYGYRGVSARAWPTGDELRFDDKVVSRYAPDYVSEADYRKLLAENKALRGASSKRPGCPTCPSKASPGIAFPQKRRSQNGQAIDRGPAIRRPQPAAQSIGLHEILNQTASPTARKLTNPRWQAEFDLALGRVLANKARLDGYNSMIAALKCAARPFKTPRAKNGCSNRPIISKPKARSKKMAEKAKTYLDRVIQEHPGTPWAKIAEEELKTPLGWKWKEA